MPIPGLGTRAARYVVGDLDGKCSGSVTISPSQRNAAVASWWLENCYSQIKGVTMDMTDREEDTGNAFGWWLSKPEFIKVGGWDRLAWLSIAAKIHDDIINNGVTFRQATGIDSRE